MPLIFSAFENNIIGGIMRASILIRELSTNLLIHVIGNNCYKLMHPHAETCKHTIMVMNGD